MFVKRRAPWTTRFPDELLYNCIIHDILGAPQIGFQTGDRLGLGAVRNAVGIRVGEFCGNMKVSFQATRSIG